MSDDLSEVFGPEPTHRSPQPKLPSEAWHHPRKQFVRLNQWCREIERLARELSLSKGTPFRYLTLPGDELLDVRAVHHVCQRRDIPLRFIGFNSVGRNTPGQAELHLSESEVRALPNVDRFSAVLEDRLENVANVNTMAARRVKIEGPFDAINLDLCNSITQWPFNSPKSTMAALQALLGIQFQSTKPWLLFLTTKVEPGTVAPDNWDRFQRAIESNLDLSDDFSAALSDLFGVGADLRGRLPSLCELEAGELLLKVFCSGFGKWALRILAEAAPSRRLTLLSAYYYRSGSNPNMLSLAFRCDTSVQPVVDPSAGDPPLAAAEGGGPSEPAAAIALARAVALLIDLDSKLSSDVGLRNSMIEKAGRLLKLARHDDAAYVSWARGLWAA